MRQILSTFSVCMEIELIQYKMNISLLAMWANDCVVSGVFVFYLNICWGNVHYLSVLQDKRFCESDGIVVITIFFMDERFCAFVLLLSICCINNAFFIMLQYLWPILYSEVKSVHELYQSIIMLYVNLCIEYWIKLVSECETFRFKKAN